jgi:uncharacterized protein (DUF1919 family)
MDINWLIRNEIRELSNKYLSSYRRKSIVAGRENFTIISNTCWAGHVYRYFGLPYNTPTIGCGFFADDYLRFLSDLKGYLNTKLIMFPAEESRHYETIKTQPLKFQKCPYGRLGDVEVRFAHYKTPEEALYHWEKRKERVNYNHLIVKFSEHMECSKEHILAFDSLPYHDKFVFTAHDYNISSQILFKEFLSLGDVKDDTLHFNKYINLVKMVNGTMF